MIAFVKLDNYWASYLPYCFLHMGYHLRENGIPYKIFHNAFAAKFEDDKRRFLDEITALKPHIVGLSVITGRQARDSAEFSILLKARMPEIKILWGGIHPTILPEQCIKQPYIDYVLQGEADSTICAFYHAFMNKKSFDTIPGCWWKEDKDILHSQLPIPIENSENIGLDFSGIERLDDYIYSGGLSLITSRGCPFQCQFCFIQSLRIRKWRPFSMDLVKPTIDLLKSTGISRLHINDDNFYVDFDRAVSILEYAQLPSFSEIRIPTLIKDKRMKILHKLKCNKLLSGGESCDDEILGKIKKGHTFEQMREAMFLFRKYKSIEPSWSFILGMPIETWDNIATTIKGKAELERIVGRDIGRVGLYMPYPGSPIYEIALAKGFKEPQNPMEWGCIERYGPDGVKHPPEHELLPWVDVKKVWTLLNSQRFERKKRRNILNWLRRP